jgi:2-dehydro-3-deoxyphosphogalactonate aldolase
MSFEEAAQACGIVAILRGIQPGEVVAVGAALHAAGIRVVEVPLNSPDPFASISALAKAFAGRLVVGAGTVLDVPSVNLLKASGGTISVSPDCNPEVITRAVQLGLTPLPGVFTPTEAFAAIRAGAAHLKLFPAEAASPVTVKAWKAVLPRQVRVYAVGGVTPANMQAWADAGCAGFGIGSNIYKPGMTADDVATSAAGFVAAWNSLKRNGR